MRSLYLQGCLPVIKPRCCLRLTYKRLRVPCTLLMSTFQLQSPPSFYLPLSSFLSPLSFARSPCDITVWLGRAEKWLALEIDVAVCSWPHSRSHGRHTSLLMHTRPHISTLSWYVSARFGLHSDSELLLTHRRWGGTMWVAAMQVSLNSWEGKLTFLPGSAPYWGWKEWLKVWVCVCEHLLSPVCIQWAHSWPRLNLTDSINHPKLMAHQEACMSVFERKKTHVVPQFLTTYKF